MMAAVTGASSSGKSAFAEQFLMNMGEKRRIYIATMIAWDEECRERIRKHRAMRMEKRFETMECPVDLLEAEIPEHAAVLLECMSNLAANEMYRAGREEPKPRILAGLRRLKSRAEDLVIVTNEIFDEPGLYGEETEQYRKLLGDLNREIFSMADEVYEVVCGIPAELKKSGNREYRSGKGIHMTIITGGAYQGKAEFARRLLSAGAGAKTGVGTKEEADTGAGAEMSIEAGAGMDAETMAGPDGNLCADGKRDEFQAAFERRLILNFHEYIRRFSVCTPEEARKKMGQFVDALIEKNPNAVITADEIGSGIVPLSPEDRLWRDLEGEAIQKLAREAAEVYRVIGGIPQPLKRREGGQP